MKFLGRNLHLRHALIVLFAMTSATAAAATRTVADPLSIEWLSYRQAQAAGRDLDRPVLLLFTTEASCDPCRVLERETFRDRRVIRYVSRHFVAARVEALQLEALASKYDVETLPTLWLLDSSGDALTRMYRDLTPEKLLDVLEYVRTKAYEATDFETWWRHKKKR